MSELTTFDYIKKSVENLSTPTELEDTILIQNTADELSISKKEVLNELENKKIFTEIDNDGSFYYIVADKIIISNVEYYNYDDAYGQNRLIRC